MIIRPAKRIRGQLTLPGDKSISHRAAILAGIAHGVSRISNYSTSADCASTLSCLGELGVRIEASGAEILVHGAGSVGLQPPTQTLDCGNSGTTMRLLAGVLAGQNFIATLTGDESLRSRPMQRIIEPLETMGARISSVEGRAPLQITGRSDLQAIEYELLVASAQVKSCILLAGLNAAGRTVVIENEATRDHTERMLAQFGAPVEARVAQRAPLQARFAAIEGPAQLRACDISIPGDISSAAYFIVAAALLPGSSLEINHAGLNPTRILFLKQLQAVGFDIAISEVKERNNEPIGRITISGVERSPRATNECPLILEGALIPQLIDELPLLAVVGSQLDGGIEIRGAKELRFKETDRIEATAANLRAMGTEVEEFADGLRIAGATRLRGAQIDPRGDHRIAMAFTVAGLIAEGETEIKDSDCVAVSFPEFFDLLNSVVEDSTGLRALG